MESEKLFSPNDAEAVGEKPAVDFGTFHFPGDIVQRVLAGLPEAVLVLNPDTRFIYDCNSAAERMFRYVREELVGKESSFLHLSHEDFESFHRESDEAVLLKGLHETEHVYVRKTGENFETRNIIISVCASRRNFPFFLYIIKDISREKAKERSLKASEERLKAVLQNMPVLLLALNKADEVVAWNHAAERTTGYSNFETMGRRINWMFPDEASYRSFLEILGTRHRSAVDWEMSFPGKNGAGRTILWSAISSDYPVEGWKTWAVGLDITERKRQEEQKTFLLIQFEKLAEEWKKLSGYTETGGLKRKSLGDYGVTDREEAVASLVYRGKANKVIASGLGISEGTVKAHISSIFRKTSVHSRIEFVRRVDEENLDLR